MTPLHCHQVCYQELQTAYIGILVSKIFIDAAFDYFYPLVMAQLSLYLMEKALLRDEETGEQR